MDMNANSKKDNINNFLKFPLSKSGKTSPSYDKRLANIFWIRNLDRVGLEYGKKERQLLIYETDAGEKIFIQYPGKESLKKGDYKKPWDFRPKVYIERSLSWLEDMSFLGIWDIMNDNFKKILDSNKIEVFEAIAVLFYRMAFMIDHLKSDKLDTKYIELSFENGIEKEAKNPKLLKLPSFYKYSPNRELLDYLENKCRTIWGCLSLEGFLFYNELLTWNEDCKYYYRNVVIKKKKDWIGATGRVNTALTHMRIISFLLGYVPLSRVCMGFSRGRGVSPIENKEVQEYFKDYIISGELF